MWNHSDHNTVELHHPWFCYLWRKHDYSCVQFWISQTTVSKVVDQTSAEFANECAYLLHASQHTYSLPTHTVDFQASLVHYYESMYSKDEYPDIDFVFRLRLLVSPLDHRQTSHSRMPLVLSRNLPTSIETIRHCLLHDLPRWNRLSSVSDDWTWMHCSSHHHSDHKWTVAIAVEKSNFPKHWCTE